MIRKIVYHNHKPHEKFATQIRELELKRYSSSLYLPVLDYDEDVFECFILYLNEDDIVLGWMSIEEPLNNKMKYFNDISYCWPSKIFEICKNSHKVRYLEDMYISIFSRDLIKMIYSDLLEYCGQKSIGCSFVVDVNEASYRLFKRVLMRLKKLKNYSFDINLLYDNKDIISFEIMEVKNGRK